MNDARQDGQWLWAALFGSRTGFLALASKEQGGRFRNRYFAWPAEVDGAWAWAVGESVARRDVFFSVSLLRRPKRTKAAALPGRIVWADDDGGAFDGPLVASVVIQTSPGRHHRFWLLDDVVPPEVAERLSRDIAYSYGHDRSGWDSVQLLRVPGTFNFKRDEPYPVSVIESTGEVYTASQFGPAQGHVEPPATQAAAPTMPNHVPASRSDEGLLARLPVRRDDGGVDESRSIYSLAAALRHAGVAKAPALAAVADLARRFGWAKYDDRPVELVRIIGKLWPEHVDRFDELPLLLPSDHPYWKRQEDWIVEGVVPAASVVALVGAPGTYKSFLAIDLALSVATGRPWQDRRTRQGQVVYLALEGHGTIEPRIAVWNSFNEANGVIRLALRPLLFDSKVDMDELQDAVTRLGDVRLIVVDTFAAGLGTLNENAAGDVAAVIHTLSELARRTGAAVLILHHSGKGGAGPRGSSAFLAGVDALIEVRVRGPLVTLTWSKVRFGGAPSPLHLRVEPHATSLVVVPGGPLLAPGRNNGLQKCQGNHEVDDSRVLEMLAAAGPSGLRAVDLGKDYPRSRSTLYRDLDRLLEAGLVMRQGRQFILAPHPPPPVSSS